MTFQAAINEPHHFNPEMEAAVIGQILAAPVSLSEALAHCSATDFAWEPHARIVESAQVLREEYFSVTPTTVASRLSGEVVRTIEAKTGLTALDYLSGLANGATPFQKVGDLAKLLADLAHRRRIDNELDAARQRLRTYERPVMGLPGGRDRGDR